MEIALNIVNCAGTMAAVALLYGVVRRLSWTEAAKRSILGAAFGLGAVCSMLQPILVFDGMIVDFRTLFLGFAGAFLGLGGALTALVVAGTGRLLLGVTAAAYAGITGLALAAFAGVLWRKMDRRLAAHGARFVVLGAMISVSFLTLLFVPQFWRTPAPFETIGLLTVVNLLGSSLFGSFIYREQAQAKREAEALEAASLDPLTGVLNRRGFSARFCEAETVHPSKGSAMLLVDIDHFKAVNDTYGHSTGDVVLKLIGERIRMTVRPQDLVLRAGGEEFGVLLTDVDELSAKASAERIRGSLSAPCELPDSSILYVTASIGGVCWATGNRSEESASVAADKALYRAKSLGRNRSVFDLTTANS